MRCSAFMYMNSVSEENTSNAKYTCGMMINQIVETVTSIYEQ